MCPNVATSRVLYSEFRPPSSLRPSSMSHLFVYSLLFLFIYCLLKDSVSSSDCIESNGRMINE
jgi:hypothetical protein